eukprot:230538-Alexandrium_andersonii.AAC.1
MVSCSWQKKASSARPPPGTKPPRQRCNSTTSPAARAADNATKLVRQRPSAHWAATPTSSK